MGATVEVRLPGPLTEDVVAAACARVREGLVTGRVTRVACHLDGVPSDLLVVEALARLALAVRRAGAVLVVTGGDVDLPPLLRLVGLSDLLPGRGSGCSVVRPDPCHRGRSAHTVAAQSPRGGVE